MADSFPECSNRIKSSVLLCCWDTVAGLYTSPLPSMPLARRRSSFLGQSNVERNPVILTAEPRATFVGMAPVGGTSVVDGISVLGTRVSRRALGISSVFLHGLRSSASPGAGQRAMLGPAPGHVHGMNSCLAEYRDKVHTLETLNQQLEEQIGLCLERNKATAAAWDGFRNQWEDVYRQVSEAILDNARLMLQTENVQANAEDFKERYENDQPFRKAVEEEVSLLHKVLQEANISRNELEEHLENMRTELRTLEQNHEEDVRALYQQMLGDEVAELDAPVETGLDQIMDWIRSTWQKVIEKNRAETDCYLETKQTDSVASMRTAEDVEFESLQSECHNSSCKIQNLQAEIESTRALKRGLESTLSDAKQWHNLELQNLSSFISKLEAELADVRGDIEQQQRDYDALMSNKTRLEIEIGTYHGILDGEETRYQPIEPWCPVTS